jgi:hypothetical protein
MYQLTDSEKRFFKSFKTHMGQYEVTEKQFIAFLNDDISDTPMHEYTALSDAYYLWRDAIEGVNYDTE